MTRQFAKRTWRVWQTVVLPVLGLVAMAGHCLQAAADPYPINERPMYGGLKKTPEMQRADQKFISAIKAKGLSREEGAELTADRGWQLMRKGDHKTAMKRFNQAWLLDPRNGSAYWGMAAVVTDREGNMERADDLFKRALSFLPEDADLHVDYGRFLGKLHGIEIKKGKVEKGRKALDGSTASFRRALELNPEARDAHAGLAFNLFMKKDPAGSYRHLRITLERGEGDGFPVIPIIKCMMDMNITHIEDERGRNCVPANLK